MFLAFLDSTDRSILVMWICFEAFILIFESITFLILCICFTHKTIMYLIIICFPYYHGERKTVANNIGMSCLWAHSHDKMANTNKTLTSTKDAEQKDKQCNTHF